MRTKSAKHTKLRDKQTPTYGFGAFAFMHGNVEGIVSYLGREEGVIK